MRCHQPEAGRLKYFVSLSLEAGVAMISRGVAECHALGDDGRSKTRFEEEESTSASGFFKDTLAIGRNER